jgi:hypothetical protein
MAMAGPLVKPIPATSEPMVSEQPYQDDPLHRERIEWVKARKCEYYESQGFKTYKRRCERIKTMINQEWEHAKKTTKYGFRFGILRAAYDNYTDALVDLFDLDEFLSLTSLKADPNLKSMAVHLQDYANNMLQSIGYKKTWWKRCSYLPDYGWSPAYGDFVYQEGYRPKIRVDAQTVGGFKWEREWTTVLNEARSQVLHPYNWWGNPYCSGDYSYQGYTVRWYLPDIIAAEQKVDADNRPLYNQKALDLLKGKLTKRESMADPYFTVAENRDLVKSSLSQDKIQIPYVDVTVYTGTLQGCKGHESDFNTYILETCGEYMLRFAEDMVSGLFPSLTHARTHPFRNSPFSRSFLDAVVPHQSINDLLINLAIENQVDSMHRMWAYYNDDLLDEGELKNPRGTNSFLELKNPNGFIPRVIENGQGNNLRDLQVLRDFLEQDRQRVGTPDQEIGIPGNGQGDTATQANILKSASTKKVRACAKRISADALVPECRYLLLQSLMHSTPDKLRMTSRDGEVIQLTPEHMQLFVTGLDFRINDNVTRDKWEEAARSANFWANAFKVAPQLGSPDTAIKLLRAQAHQVGEKQDLIDQILPEPQPIDANTGAPAAPLPGSPGLSFLPGETPAPEPPLEPAMMEGAPNVLAA